MKTFVEQRTAGSKEETVRPVSSPRQVQAAFPLHPAQHDVYREQLIDTESPFYNVGGYVKLKGRLDKEKLREAISTAPQIFDAFRMRFHVQETEVVCYFEPDDDRLQITELDFSKYTTPEEEARHWMKQRFDLAFVLHRDKKLFENALLKIAADEHWFFMRYHHLIMDGYGFKVWLQYLAGRYRLWVAGDDTFLCYPLYADEIRKANEYRRSSFFQLESLYWKERMAEKPKTLLQSRYHNSYGRKALTFTYHLPEDQRKLLLHLQLRTQSNIQHLTIAALLIYFGRITGESTFVFGIPLHKRESKQMRRVVGMFSSILPFKGNFQPETRVDDFLKKIALLLKRDYRHKNFLAGDISRHLQLNPCEESLYEVVVNFESLSLELNFGNSIQATAVQLNSKCERIPLQLCWQDFGNRQPLQLQVIFREDYFAQTEIESLLKRLFFILEQFPAKLEKEIGSLDIVPLEERQLLKSFNDTAVSYSCEKSLIELFELQAAKTPQRTAVAFDEKQLTYQGLNEKANQLAHYLKQKGVKQGMLVPLCIERSLEMIISIFAILKSGGTYVPVDPAYPLERIHYMLNDIGATVVITSDLYQSKLPAYESLEYIRLDKDWSLIAAQPTGNLGVIITHTNLVYVIYTSGSTGKPKGVQMPGSNLVNLLHWQEQQFQQTYRHVLQFSSLNFDVSFQEIFSSLCFGSTLYLIREGQRSDIAELTGVINRYGITHLFIPCIVLKSLAEYILTYSVNPLPLKTIIVAGEQLLITNDIRQWLDSSGITLINQYGPTEAHVVSSYTIHHRDAAATRPPIGKPISNSCIYVLDSHLRLLPPGIAGEICIAGAGVAKGYLHNEPLTAEKFIDNPFGEGKLYHTGDIGRWLPDGNLEFLYRLDDQVKIRGYRIEPGEIESVLQECALVSQSIVVAGENSEGTKQLVCYVVPKQGFDQNAVVAFLEARLPKYMIPSLFIPLQTLPVTINGKLDKDKLPAPDAWTANEYTAPKTAMEATLARIWQEVLGIEQVSIHDNFFELGGHSLLVVKTIAYIEKQTGINVPPGSLFQYPTVETFARFLLKNHSTENTGHIVPIKTGGAKIPLYIICHFGVAPLSRFIPFASLLDEQQPVFGMHLPEVTELDINSISIECIADTYVADLLVHNPQGPYALVGYSIGGMVAVEVAKQLEAKGKKIVLLGLFDTVAYTEKTQEAAIQANATDKKRLGLYAHLKKMTNTLYNKIDTYLYYLKIDPQKTILNKKKSLIRKVKRLFKINVPMEQKTESQLLHERIQKFSMAAYKNYRLTPYSGNITLFRAKRRTFYVDDPEFLGWMGFAKSVKVYNTRGNHYTIFHPAYCKHLAKMVQQCLDECSDNPGSVVQ